MNLVETDWACYEKFFIAVDKVSSHRQSGSSMFC